MLASIEKVVPTLEDVSTLIRLLARSATGQEISTYTTFSTGPAARRRSGRARGLPRRASSTTAARSCWAPSSREVLRCIRCGACMNHCPVYSADRRPRLRLGLSGPDRRGADAGADRRAKRRAPAQRLDLLRALRGGVPDEDPAAEA